jgi:hypothetical protein
MFSRGNSPDEYWAKQAQQHNEEAKQREPIKPTSLSEALAPGTANVQEARKEKLAETAAGTYSARSFIERGQGMPLPPGDPLALRHILDQDIGYVFLH